MGAAQGAATTASSGSLLGLLLMPIGAAVGGAAWREVAPNLEL